LTENVLVQILHVFLLTVERVRSLSVFPADRLRRRLLSSSHDRSPRPQAREPSSRQIP